MYTGLLHFHSFWAYLVLITLLIALLNAFAGLLGRKTFTGRDRRLTLFALIAAHIQLLLGIILYFVSPVGSNAIAAEGGAVMRNAALRLYAIEHPLIMIISITLITIGYSRSKKAARDQVKFRTVAITYAVALLLILTRIPWGAWFN